MTVCSKIRGVTKSYEWVADLFSLMAVVMLFGTIWAGVEYQRPLLGWMSQNIITHGSAVIAAIVLDVFLIILFLNIGSSRFSDSPGELLRHFSRSQKGRRLDRQCIFQLAAPHGERKQEASLSC